MGTVDVYIQGEQQQEHNSFLDITDSPITNHLPGYGTAGNKSYHCPLWAMRSPFNQKGKTKILFSRHRYQPVQSSNTSVRLGRYHASPSNTITRAFTEALPLPSGPWVVSAFVSWAQDGKLPETGWTPITPALNVAASPNTQKFCSRPSGSFLKEIAAVFNQRSMPSSEDPFAHNSEILQYRHFHFKK